MLPGSHSQAKKAGLSHWATRVLEECDKASLGFEADPVHDLRVAIRRCRSMADGFLSVDPDPAWKQMKRLAKPLFSSLGELRDTQVMLEWVAKFSAANDPLGASLSGALSEKESELKATAQAALTAFDRKHWASLNAHLAKRTDRVPLEGLVFQHLALERWTDARQLHRRALQNRSGAAYHQLRIGIKRFRYTVENFLPQRHEKWSKDLRDLQDALGEVHDFDVLRYMLRAHPGGDAEERVRWMRRIRQERDSRLNLYRQKMLGRHSLWQNWRADLPSGQLLEEAAIEKLRCWASYLDPDTGHASLVRKLALQLYDGLSQCGILQHNAEHRQILETAALLHEVGRSKMTNGRGKHQRRGFRMVCKLKPPLGWNEEKMYCVAVLVRYHRGALPQANENPFAGLSAGWRDELMPIMGVLRLANALDDAHDGSISRVAVRRQNGTLLVYGQGLQEISPSAQRIARARYLLETVCGQPIMVRPLLGKGAMPARTVRSHQPSTPS